MTTTATTPAPFTGEWTAPDGTVWPSRRMIDPDYPTNPRAKKWAAHQIGWPRLWKLSVEIETPDAPPIPERIRRYRAHVRPADGSRRARDKVWVYHPDDVLEHAKPPDINAAFKAAQRQEAIHPHTGEKCWVIAPCLVAERLGIDPSLVSIYARDGIPWMRTMAGKKIKPVPVWAKYGHYGRKADPFWLEDQVEEFKRAWDALPKTPSTDLVIVKKANEKRSLKVLSRMGREECILKTDRSESRKGAVRRVPYTVRRRLIPAEDLTDDRSRRAYDQRPPNTMTIKEIASLFEVTETEALRRFPPNVRREGTLRCVSSNGAVQLRYGKHFIPIAKVRRDWERRKPGEPWPVRTVAQPSEPGAAGANGQDEKRSESARGGRGRRYDPDTAKMQKWCYEVYHKPTVKLNAAVRKARTRFPNHEWEPATIRQNAKRWARRKKLPFRPRTAQKP